MKINVGLFFSIVFSLNWASSVEINDTQPDLRSAKQSHTSVASDTYAPKSNVITCDEDDGAANKTGYRGTYGGIKGLCVFKDLNINDTKYTFRAKTSQNEEITKIWIVDSTVLTFGPEICNEFPNLRELVLENLGLRIVKHEAFRNCKNLFSLSLAFNGLSDLSDGVFK